MNLLYFEFVVDVIFRILGKIALRNSLNELVGRFQALCQGGSDVLRVLCGKVVNGGFDQRIDVCQAVLEEGRVAALAEAGNSHQRYIDAIEKRRFLFWNRDLRRKTVIRAHLLFGGWHAGPAVLGSLMTQAQARHLFVI